MKSTPRRFASVIDTEATAASPAPAAMAGRIVSHRRAWTVQVTWRASQRARARSTSKPAGVPSGSVKAKGGSSWPVTMSSGFNAARSGLGGGAAGSHSPGTKTSGGGAARAGTRATGSARASAASSGGSRAGRRRDAVKAVPLRAAARRGAAGAPRALAEDAPGWNRPQAAASSAVPFRRPISSPFTASARSCATWQVPAARWPPPP